LFLRLFTLRTFFSGCTILSVYFYGVVTVAVRVTRACECV
jgi:hypothetical protein